MPPVYGSAAFVWTDATSETQRVHQLAVPLKTVLPSFRQRVYQNDSVDLTVREVITVGAGAYELSGEVAYDDDAQSLLDLLVAGAQGAVLTYIPDTTKSDQSYDCYLIEPTPDKLALVTARDWPQWMEYGVAIKLRRIDGSAFRP